MPSPNPWRALRGLPHLILAWRADLPEHLHGATSGRNIWMRSGLTQVERRCAIAHELQHRERGHDECQPESVERVVRHYAARYLLHDVHAIADAVVWSQGRIDEAADALWVTPAVLRDRLDRAHLHPAEVAVLRARWDSVEWPL